MKGWSLRSRWIAASVLWTCGLLMLMHMASVGLMHVFPWMMRLNHHRVSIVGVAMMVAGFAVARASVASFRPLRGMLAAVRRGDQARVEGQYPAEVRPLIEELNALLEARERAVERARAAAADLAHGLKTPLAVLAQEADRAAARGDAALASSIGGQVDRMSRQVDYQLARARSSASGAAAGARCEVRPCVDALVRTVSKLHAQRGLAFESHAPAGLTARIRVEDLEEVLGNLLDNACQWAKSRVAVTAEASGAGVEITVDDDGPGLDAALRRAVLDRGVRADQSAPGTGLGLAIVRDLCELHGGSIRLEDSPLGGLRARVALPGERDAVADGKHG